MFAMIADRNWFKIKPVDNFMEQAYNANNRALQYYLNTIKMYEFSLFANAVVFATEVPTVYPTALKFVKDGKTITSLSIDVSDDPVEVEVVTTPYSANATISPTSSAQGKATVALKSGTTKTVVITPVDDGNATITASASNGTTTISTQLALTVTDKSAV